MTLYSFANRRERDAPKPGPTPAITASPVQSAPSSSMGQKPLDAITVQLIVSRDSLETVEWIRRLRDFLVMMHSRHNCDGFDFNLFRVGIWLNLMTIRFGATKEDSWVEMSRSNLEYGAIIDADDDSYGDLVCLNEWWMLIPFRDKLTSNFMARRKNAWDQLIWVDFTAQEDIGKPQRILSLGVC